MRQARVNNIAVGVESPIAEELQAMKKHLDPKEMIGLIRLYHKAGFRIHGMFIFGYPALEDRPFRMSAQDRARHFRSFLRKARLDTVQVLLPIPLPGTELARRLRKANRIYSTQDIGLEYYDGSFPLFQPDEPMTPENLQLAVRKIMGRFYGPRHMLATAIYVIAFPAIALWFHHIRTGWQKWYRRWSGSIYRSGGWLLFRKWTANFRKDSFLGKLEVAKRNDSLRQQRGAGSS